MFIFKISDYLIFVKICSFHERNYLIFSLSITIMSLKSLFALLYSIAFLLFFPSLLKVAFFIFLSVVPYPMETEGFF